MTATTYLDEVFNLTQEIVTHTDDIISLVMIGVVLAIVFAVAAFIKGLLDRALKGK